MTMTLPTKLVLTILVLLALLGLILKLQTQPVMAQVAPNQQCAPMKDIEEFLARKHGEYATLNLHANSFAYVLHVNPETQSWTLIGERADGVGCFLAAGEGVSEAIPYKGPAL